MASTTPNIGLTLPTGAEKVSRQIINDNNTKIDTAIGTLNGKIGKSTLVSASSLADLKTNLLAILNSVDISDFVGIRIAPSFSSDGFTSGSTYGGYAYNIYKNNGTTTYFSAVVSNNLGEDMFIGYNGGTWKFNSLTNNLVKTVTETIKSNASGYVQFPANRFVLNAMNGNYNKCIIFKNPGSSYFMARGYHTYQNTTQVNFDASTDYSITYDYIQM